MSKKKKRRVQPGASCADILRNIRNIMNKTAATLKYKTGAMKRNLAPAANFENLQVGMVFN